MEPTNSNISSLKPLRIVELAEFLPGLNGVHSHEILSSVKKLPRTTMAVTRTAERVFKPMTIAEMNLNLRGLRNTPASKSNVSVTTLKKREKCWNSSVKVNKTVSRIPSSQLQRNCIGVRKTLNFQYNLKPQVENATKTVNSGSSDTSKFHKPQTKAKKSFMPAANNPVRISGVFNIPETPVVVRKQTKYRKNSVNKENIPKQTIINKNMEKATGSIVHKMIVTATPLSNDSLISNSDASFLQKEKEINEFEEKIMGIATEHTLENIANISPPISTPFKEYRNANDFFNTSSDAETSVVYHDDTITCSDKTSTEKLDKKDESAIGILCDLLNKAMITKTSPSAKQNYNELETEIKREIMVINNIIDNLTLIKQSRLKLLKKAKCAHKKATDNDKTSINFKDSVDANTPQKLLSGKKSPSYKIPRKSISNLRKQVCHKSMLNPQSPDRNKAMTMYMKMKQQMNFLNTPVVKHNNVTYTDTHTVTSNNLQMQLNKLFNES